MFCTTGEHPFCAYEKVWTPAQVLTPEDWILTDTGDWKQVEEIWNTGDLETVYNLRVADHHTYFVGDESWGWSAWVHNTYAGYVIPVQDRITDPKPNLPCYVRQKDGGSGLTTGIMSWTGHDSEGNPGELWIVIQSTQSGLPGHVEAQGARLMKQENITTDFLTINNPDGPYAGCKSQNSEVYKSLPPNNLLRVECVPFKTYFHFRKV